MLLFFVFVLETNLEHFWEILSKIMRGSTLNASTTDRHVNFDSCGIVSACKSLLIWLPSSYNRDSKKIFVSLGVDLKNLVDKFICFFFSSMRSVAFLPKEFPCSDERSRVLEFPSDDIRPLIEKQGEVSMWMDPFGISRVHDGLTSGTDGDWFRHLTLSTLCNPSNFRRKSLDVTLFFVQCSFGHKHREIAVLNANFFYSLINKALDLLPNEVREGS